MNKFFSGFFLPREGSQISGRKLRFYWRKINLCPLTVSYALRKFVQLVSRYLFVCSFTFFVAANMVAGRKGRKRFGSSEKCDQNSVRKCVEVCI